MTDPFILEIYSMIRMISRNAGQHWFLLGFSLVDYYPKRATQGTGHWIFQKHLRYLVLPDVGESLRTRISTIAQKSYTME